MVRWELYVNFFYSWIIFSLRCHQVEFSVLHWNEYSSQGYSFWKICREKEEKPKPPFLPPLHVALNMHSSLGLAKQYTASVCFWAGALSSPGVLSCGTKGSNKSQHKCKSLQDWGLQEQPEQWRVALVLPQGDEDAWAHHSQSEPLLGGEAVTKQLWADVTRTAVSSPPALKKPTDYQENGQNGINVWVKWCGYWTGGRKFRR